MADKTKADGHKLTVQDNGTKSRGRLMAELALSGVTNGAVVAADYAKAVYGELDLTECIEIMGQKVKAVQGGNLAEADALLTAQAISLDAIYTALARRALMNMGEYTGAADTYMRLALKAQSQSRATLETLAEIKYPPIVIAKQANISNGPQQVNNSIQGNNANGCAPAPACAANSENQPNKLLEESHEERMDTRAPQAAGRTDPELETVGALNRPPHG